MPVKVLSSTGIGTVLRVNGLDKTVTDIDGVSVGIFTQHSL